MTYTCLVTLHSPYIHWSMKLKLPALNLEIYNLHNFLNISVFMKQRNCFQNFLYSHTSSMMTFNHFMYFLFQNLTKHFKLIMIRGCLSSCNIITLQRSWCWATPSCPVSQRCIYTTRSRLVQGRPSVHHYLWFKM